MYCLRVESTKAAGHNGAPPARVQVSTVPVPIGVNMKSRPFIVQPSLVCITVDCTPLTVLPILMGAKVTELGAALGARSAGRLEGLALGRPRGLRVGFGLPMSTVGVGLL